MAEPQLASVLGKLDAVKETLSVRRAFGEPYQVDGTTVIPVVTVRGGGGGGGGEGQGPDSQGNGSGAGLGFGVVVRPLGVYSVRDGNVTWMPALDVMRLVLGGQVVAVVALLTLRAILKKR